MDRDFFAIFFPFYHFKSSACKSAPSSSAWKSPPSRKYFFGNTKSIPVQSKLGKVLLQAIRILLIEGALLRFKVSNIFYQVSKFDGPYPLILGGNEGAKGRAAMICGDGIQNHWAFMSKSPPDFLIPLHI